MISKASSVSSSKLAIIIISALLFFSSCGTPRKVPQGQALLHENKIVGLKPIYKEGANNYLKQKPNSKFFGIGWLKISLGIYNNFSWKNETKFNRWIRNRMGEEPVVYDSSIANFSRQQMELYLFNKGFFNAEVNYKTSIKKRKAYVEYQAVPGNHYTIRNIHYQISDTNIRTIYFFNLQQSELRMNDGYDLDKINAERERLTRLLRNHGYYYFNKELIYFNVDTSLGTGALDIYLNISAPDQGDHIAYRMSAPVIRIQAPEAEKNKRRVQTIDSSQNTIIDDPSNLVKHGIIRQMVFLDKDDLFQERNLELSYNRLGDLGMFRFVNVDFNRSLQDSMVLTPTITLTPGKRRSTQFELEGYVASENLGSSVNITYRDKNVFRGAEIFEFRIKAAIETQTFLDDNTGNVPLFNSTETNTSLSVTYPGFLLFRDKKTFGLYGSPKTRIGVNFISESRPEYFRNTTTGTFTYDWKQNQKITHSFSPATINIVNSVLSDEALQSLEDLNNQYIKESFDPHITLGMRYTFSYSNQILNARKDYYFLRFNVEVMGTGLYALSRLQDKSKSEKGQYTFFGLPYFNFTRPELDYRYFNFINKHSQMVWRINSGFGYAYWNSTVLPFERQFYTGGSNSLRAFRARSVGPGEFSSVSNSNLNLDQTGEMRIEGNAEYRFDIFDRFIGAKLKGACFVDAGNVWLIKKANNNPEGLFEFKDFYEEFAIGTGLGLRLDYSFLLFRFDFGLKIRDPRFEGSERWVITNLNNDQWIAKNNYSFLNFNFGIGYPF